MRQDSAYFRALNAKRRHPKGWPKNVKRSHVGCMCKLCMARPLRFGLWPRKVLTLISFTDRVQAMAQAHNNLTNDLTGEKITRLRHTMDLSQAKFASQVGVTIITLSRWENSHMRPSPRHRKRIYEIAQAAHMAIAEEGRTEAPDFS